ncbi:fatty acid desaturase family protein [Streptomyces sp. 3211]|uniref:fatty acid desaturase family protein n=1 Tax=Streptomyces sp. 3211 TaxID=1964449 RepID=UPI0009A4D101|nr:fatty acid desaturase family protein [Streptomyces sp. 3211]
MTTNHVSPVPADSGAAVRSTVPPEDENTYRKGYRLPPGLREEIAAAHRSRPALTVICALADSAVALTAAVLCAWLLVSTSPLCSVPGSILGCVLIARQLRALENLTHEASHYNWSRHRRRMNDVLAWLLAGLPTGGRLSDYRASHLRHHGRFGTSQDPDQRRYAELELESMDRSSAARFAGSVLVRIWHYQVGWLHEVKSDLATTAGALLWSVALVAGPAALLAGPVAALVAEGLWVVSAFVVLPVLRLIAEADEHIYSDSGTVFDATISNVGLLHRVLVHPHADGYHTVHHLWPGIPHHALRRVHFTLMVQDPEYARRIRIRRRLLDTPQAVAVAEQKEGA